MSAISKKNINDAIIQKLELQTLDVGCRSTLNGLLIITSPLLYQGGSKSTTQCEDQADKPQYIDRNRCIGWSKIIRG